MQLGSKTNRLHFAKYYKDKEIAVMSTKYNMYPNSKYPDFIEDAAVAVYVVSENISKYTVNAKNICRQKLGGERQHTLKTT